MKGKLTADPSYKCKRCKGICRPINGRPENHVTLEGSKLDVVESYHYLGDELCPGGDCELATIARNRAAWGKFGASSSSFFLDNIISKAWNVV